MTNRKPTVQEWAGEVSRLTEAIDAALRARYRVALDWRAANPLKPVPGHLYAQLADYARDVAEIRRTATMTPRGELKALRDMAGRYGVETEGVER